MTVSYIAHQAGFSKSLRMFRHHFHRLLPRLTHVSDHDQLSLILDILGTPSIDDFYAISSPRSREYIRALPFRKGKDFSTMFAGTNPLVGVHCYDSS